MGLFSKKVDYDELYRKLSTEKMTPDEARKAEKELKKLAKSGDKRGVIWRPLTSVQIQSVGSVNMATSEFEEAEHKYGICEEYVRVRSLPIVFNLFNESYVKYNDPKGAVFVARAYEHGWGVEKNHGKAVEIIRETENYPKDGIFRLNSGLIKNAYKEITGTEFPDSKSSKQKEKQAISDARKNQNEQPQSDVNFKRLELDGGDVYEGETQNGKRHGKGKYTWADGDFYEGDWKDGKRCGHGKLIQYGKSPSGETYVKRSYDGEWLDSKEHGHGICVEGDFGWEKMDKVFEGEWVNGKRQGRFIWYLTNSNGGRYINFYEDGNLIETCIPYDESIKTVEDIRRAKGKTSGASENLNHMNMSKIPSWDSVKSGDYSDKVKKETEARRQYIRETVRRLRNPEENASPYYRNIENACMMLAPFITEAEKLFLKGEEEKALKIIEEMLDINIVPDDKWYYNSDTKYFSQFLSGALYSLASQIDFDTPDHDRFIVPAANIACYLWKKFGDHSLFYAVAHLWIEAGKDSGGNYLWIERMRDNGDYTVVSKYNEISEYYFGHDLDIYTMGSDCELF